jgi:CMP-N,N'-diacetyllegionaminic acid synthase
MKCLIVIPARGSSKRIPHKNIVLLRGKPLIQYTIDCVRDAGLFDLLVVSTEDSAIAKIAKLDGVPVFNRPLELAKDKTSTELVLLNTLDQYENDGNDLPEWIMTLPPTSPLRSASSLTSFIEKLDSVSKDIDCVMSVTENRGDFWSFEPDGNFQRLFPDAPRRQQDRTPLFEENSSIYLTRVTALKETGSILGRNVIGIPISNYESLDINTSDDLKLAEVLIKYYRM